MDNNKLARLIRFKEILDEAHEELEAFRKANPEAYQDAVDNGTGLSEQVDAWLKSLQEKKDSNKTT